MLETIPNFSKAIRNESGLVKPKTQILGRFKCRYSAVYHWSIPAIYHLYNLYRAIQWFHFLCIIATFSACLFTYPLHIAAFFFLSDLIWYLEFLVVLYRDRSVRSVEVFFWPCCHHETEHPASLTYLIGRFYRELDPKMFVLQQTCKSSWPLKWYTEH